MTPRVGIIILNWNGKDDTLECLASLRMIDYPNYEVIVIDNGSSDDSVACIQQQFPDVTMLCHEENLGFAEGNNRGIRYALEIGCQYVLLLNNDTLVASDFLSEMVAAGESSPGIGMLNPLIYRYPQDDFWFCGGEINWQNGVTRHITNVSEARHNAQEKHLLATDYVTGCALLVKTEVIRSIGLFDPRFFAYYEDTDWSIRCQQAGWQSVVVPAVKIWHKVSNTAPSHLAFLWGHRNLILFLWKHSAWWQFPFRFRRAVYKCLHEFVWNEDKRLGEAAMHGLWSALTFQFGKKYHKMPVWLLQFIHHHIRYVLRLFR